MFTKIARLMRRRSMRINVESIQDARDVQIVDDEPLPLVEREVVDTAPDLLRWCNLETPFPSVAFGGYIKYYRTHTATKDFIEPDPLFDLPVTLPPLSHNIPPSPTITSSTSTNSPQSPTKTVQEAESPKTARKARRYSLSSSFSISRKSTQLFRWKRATTIIASSIAEHDLSSLFSRSSSNPNTARRPSIEMARSLSSRASSDSSSPDSIAFGFRRHTTPDSDSTLPPNSPTSIYSHVEEEEGEEEEDGVMVESPNARWSPSELGTPSRTRSQRRPISSSSYGTAKTAFSQG